MSDADFLFVELVWIGILVASFKKCRNPIEYAGGGEAKAGVTVLNVI